MITDILAMWAACMLSYLIWIGWYLAIFLVPVLVVVLVVKALVK